MLILVELINTGDRYLFVLLIVELINTGEKYLFVLSHDFVDRIAVSQMTIDIYSFVIITIPSFPHS